ncbi:MAG: siderophore-interacting protein [Rhizobacter sp.]
MNQDTLEHRAERRVQRVRYELKRRDVQVARIEAVGPGFKRITFTGPDLADFQSAGFDDHVKFMIPDGHGDFVKRDYTPLRHDAARCELDIEFALHGHGPAAEWARTAQVGQAAVIGGPRGSMVVPTDYDWHLLAGDASALPAMHRRLSELPAGTRAIAIIEVEDDADRRALESAATLEVHWAATPQAWLDTLRAWQLPGGSGFVWCAGEASLMAQARDVVLAEKAHPREDAKIAAYWKHGNADFHEKLTA